MQGVRNVGTEEAEEEEDSDDPVPELRFLVEVRMPKCAGLDGAGTVCVCWMIRCGVVRLCICGCRSHYRGSNPYPFHIPSFFSLGAEKTVSTFLISLSRPMFSLGVEKNRWSLPR